MEVTAFKHGFPMKNLTHWDVFSDKRRKNLAVPFGLYPLPFALILHVSILMEKN